MIGRAVRQIQKDKNARAVGPPREEVPDRNLGPARYNSEDPITPRILSGTSTPTPQPAPLRVQVSVYNEVTAAFKSMTASSSNAVTQGTEGANAPNVVDDDQEEEMGAASDADADDEDDGGENELMEDDDDASSCESEEGAPPKTKDTHRPRPHQSQGPDMPGPSPSGTLLATPALTTASSSSNGSSSSPQAIEQEVMAMISSGVELGKVQQYEANLDVINKMFGTSTLGQP